MSLSVKKNENDEVENQRRVFIVPEEIEVCILCGCKTGVNSKMPANKRLITLTAAVSFAESAG